MFVVGLVPAGCVAFRDYGIRPNEAPPWSGRVAPYLEWHIPTPHPRIAHSHPSIHPPPPTPPNGAPLNSPSTSARTSRTNSLISLFLPPFNWVFLLKEGGSNAPCRTWSSARPRSVSALGRKRLRSRRRFRGDIALLGGRGG